MRQSRLLPVWAALFVLGVCLAGCAQWSSSSVKDTEYCFVPVGNKTYPCRSWATGERVPVMEAVPKGYRVIGHFRAYAADSSKFLMDAMDYNAKRVGADAIVVQNLTRNPDRHFVAEYVAEKKEVVSPSEADRKAYRERLQEFEFKKVRGIFSSPPERPQTHERVVSSERVPAHWAIRSERASVEAVFVRRDQE